MLSDKMEFSITLRNIWSVLPLTEKSTTTLCSARKSFTLRFPHAAGRNERQELQTRRQSSHGAASPSAAPGRHWQHHRALHPRQGLTAPSSPLIQDDTEPRRKSTTNCREIGQDTCRDPRIYPHPLAALSSQPETSLTSNRHFQISRSQTNPFESSAESNVRKKVHKKFLAVLNTSANKQTIKQQQGNCEKWSSARCPHS